MKFNRFTLFSFKKIVLPTIQQAIVDKLEPIFYDTELERINERSKNQSEMIGQLIEILYNDEDLTKKEAVLKLLGSDYQIEE